MVGITVPNAVTYQIEAALLLCVFCKPLFSVKHPYDGRYDIHCSVCMNKQLLAPPTKSHITRL